MPGTVQLPTSQCRPSLPPTVLPMHIPRLTPAMLVARGVWLVARLIFAIAACSVPEAQNAVWVTIPPGDSVSAVAESLAASGIVGSAQSFERFARMGRKHLGIQPGVYPMRPGTPMGQVLVELRKGRAPVRYVEVQPGIWLSELAPVFEYALGIDPESLAVAARDPELLASVGARGETIEGYIYPTAYYVPVEAGALEVLRQMVDTFEARWSPEWSARLEWLDLTRDELMTLASVIEGEDPHEEDRLLVSSVYSNRLADGLRLQADPTVVYALQRRQRLYNKDYGLDSEYNTYRIYGLPPAPINQPTTASILAALYPDSTDFYYFVARTDGRHLFSRSYREHLTTIRQIRNRSAGNGR